MELATPLMPTSVITILQTKSNLKLVLFLQRIRIRRIQCYLGMQLSKLAVLQRNPLSYMETLYRQSHVTTADDQQYYVDPPSIPLPSSPPEMQDGDHDRNHDQHDDADDYGDDDPDSDSPALSQIDLETSILEGKMSALTRQLTLMPPEGVFVAKLIMDDVEVQLDAAQCTVEDGEVALERLERLVRELHLP
jgi:hypothetical protein